MEQHGSMIDDGIHALAVNLQDVGNDETGQGLVEYAFMLLLVALVALAGLTAIGVNLIPFLQNVVNAFP